MQPISAAGYGFAEDEANCWLSYRSRPTTRGKDNMVAAFIGTPQSSTDTVAVLRKDNKEELA